MDGAHSFVRQPLPEAAEPATEPQNQRGGTGKTTTKVDLRALVGDGPVLVINAGPFNHDLPADGSEKDRR